MSSFDKYTNYNDQAGISGVVFGANKSVLEVELNEAQEINKKLLRNMTAKVCGDGITDITKITYENGVISIASDCSIAIDGIIINCTGLSMSVSSGTVYLQVWEEVVDYNATLMKEGNQDGSEVVDNYIKDSRTNEETTRRKVIKYTLSASQDDSRHNLLVATISSEYDYEINIHEINLAKLKTDFDNTIGDVQTSLDIILNGKPHIYGASWDGSSSTSWTRTDDAVDFADPIPYVEGATDYGSPFDDLQPWAGIVKSTQDEGELVAIPKFWYKITQSDSGISIQIADRAVKGFHVSPAHMDRGDGVGERDVVYIGRYHCDANYKSTSGVVPIKSITRAKARTSIHKLGSNVWQSDFAMRFTIWLLYIVEFADWNSQTKIGNGLGDGKDIHTMGYTDSMPYHTGTTQSSRDTYGYGTQYRNIEGLWDNVIDWCDGCYNNNVGFNIILNPANFSDSSNGTSVGIPSSGYPSAFGVKNIGGTFPLFIPTESNGSTATYSCDQWTFSKSSACIDVGGCFYNTDCDYYGLFNVRCNTVSATSYTTGCRLQKLP